MENFEDVLTSLPEDAQEIVKAHVESVEKAAESEAVSEEVAKLAAEKEDILCQKEAIEKRLADLEEEKVNAEYVAKAKELCDTVETDKLAALLKANDEAGCGDEFREVISALTKQSDVSDLEKEVGSSRSEATDAIPSSAEEADAVLAEKAAAYAEAEGISEVAAYNKMADLEPELYEMALKG
jgi:hypothetical protein